MGFTGYAGLAGRQPWHCGALLPECRRWDLTAVASRALRRTVDLQRNSLINTFYYKTAQVDPDTPFVLDDTDYATGRRPVADLLQYYQRVLITSTNGFLFREVLTSAGSSRPILQSYMLPHEYSTSLDKHFNVEGVSVTPAGNVSHITKDPYPHMFNTSASLRTGSLNLELENRDQTSSICQIPPGGSLSILVGFFKLKN